MPDNIDIRQLLFKGITGADDELEAFYGTLLDLLNAQVFKAGNVNGFIDALSLRALQLQLDKIVNGVFIGEAGDGFHAFDAMGRGQSDYARILERRIKQTVFRVAEKNNNWLKQATAPDVWDWLLNSPLQRSRPDLKVDTYWKWIDPSGHDLSDRVWQASYRTRQKINQLITFEVRAGSDSRKISKLLEDYLLPSRGGIKTTKPYGTTASFDGMRLARTEITHAATDTSFAAARSNPFVTGMDWALSARHPKFDICDKLCTINKQGQRVKAAYPVENAPQVVVDSHPQCLLPGTLVSVPGRILAATKALYVGRCVEIFTANGRRLSVTPNHPILTQRGWVKADRLAKGDKVVVATSIEGIMSSINPDNDNMPALIEEIFGSLEKARGVSATRMPASAEDFHSDGAFINGDVNVVYADSPLLSDDQASGTQAISQDGLNRADALSSLLYTFGASQQVLDAAFAASRCDIRGIRHCLALLDAHAGVAKWLTFREGAALDSTLQQPFFDDLTADSECLGNFILRFASFITLDDVVDVNVFEYAGHVYNLQSDPYELYISNEIITHNCICHNRPYVESVPLGNQRLREQKARGEPPPYNIADMNQFLLALLGPILLSEFR